MSGADGSSSAPLLYDQSPRKCSHDSEPRLTRSKSQYAKEYNTLDESVWATLFRDVSRIGHNLLVVCLPCYYGFRGKRGREQQLEALRNWDLWGPLFFILLLGIIVSSETNGIDDARMFSIIFTTVAVGACLLTLNVLLLGGQIVFMQALCLIGYCLFPLDLGALMALILKWWFGNLAIVIQVLVVLGCLLWSCWASIPFISEATPAGRKILAVYPLAMLYVFIAYLVFLGIST